MGTLIILIYYKKHRGGSTQATILPYAIILTKAHRAAVSIMAKGCIVARVLPLRSFFFFTTTLHQYFSVICLIPMFGDKPEVFFPKILPNSNTSCCSLPEGSKCSTYLCSDLNLMREYYGQIPPVPDHLCLESRE